MERFAGADVRRRRVEDGANPRNNFGIHFSACRSDLGAAARHLGLPPETLLPQHVSQALDSCVSHRTGRSLQLQPEMLGEQSRLAQIFLAMN